MFETLQFNKDIDVCHLSKNTSIKAYKVSMPSEIYRFLHEAAIIKYHGVLFAAWYNNKEKELQGETPIRFACSYDDGITWTEAKTVVTDASGTILYCPPVFGICDDKLYMLLNQMVAADHMHSFDLYVYNETEGGFEEVWSKQLPFKLNTNAYTLNNGKLILPGRIAELDGFPITPAVLISDSGKIDADWRLVKIQDNGKLPDGTEFVHPEVCLIVDGKIIYAFSRNDAGSDSLVYVSRDNGETWEGPYTHDLPFHPSKIYSGTLVDGRNYLIANVGNDRSKLIILFSEKGKMNFCKGYVLQDGFSDTLECGEAWHYPAAYESDGKLYVIYTVNTDGWSTRGAVISIIDLSLVE